MKIGIVTVTFNSASVLDDFFTSIEQQDYSDFNFISSITTLLTIHFQKLTDWTLNQSTFKKHQ